MKKQVNNLNKDIMESYYSYIGHSHIDNIIDELEEDKKLIDKIQVSKEKETWFKEYINDFKKKEKKIRRIKFLKKYSIKIAAFFIVCFLSISFLTISVEGFRIKLFNFLIEKNEEFTSLKIEEDHNNEMINIPDWEYYYPSYLPDGYYFETKEIFNKIKTLTFTNKSNKIIFIQGPYDSEIHLDSEDGVTSEILVNNEKSLLIEKNNQKTLIWYSMDSSFYIVSDIDVNELIKIAENIKK